MSKNVAVFVDVANIFYAAKAAGADIDYVTLLKAAVAGRDFVRAYAYTGLDPENENQRNFHAFLARHGYKVVSKDIRKYGDGKVKANLDIELVVDMMKTARNLDVAIVVSGDGDFAPAIRAVQEMGVRVEVISFRGNTSSDLIDVADAFYDITQLARVDRESSRSGRRVADDEEDLSMTEVPDKQTEGRGGRRGRGRRGGAAAEETVGRRPSGRGRGRQDEEAREPQGTGAQLVALPGERLSKARRGGAAAAAAAAGASAEAADEEQLDAVAEDQEQGQSEEPQDGEQAGRRRRRRGGRGRGHGRGHEGLAEPAEADAGEIEELEPAAPANRPNQFGSVWDSQIGMAGRPERLAPISADDEDYAEPEIPEYLLAERRRGGRGGRGQGGRGTRSAYASAVERERFGRSTGSRYPEPARSPQPSRGPRRDERPDRQPRQSQPAPQQRRGGTQRPGGGRDSAEPWSEVPPELEELLRAQMTARMTRPSEAAAAAPESGAAAETGGDAPAKAPRRGGRRKPAEAEAKTEGQAVEAVPAEAAPAPKTRSRRKPQAEGTPAAEAAVPADGGATTEAAPKKRTVRRKPAATDAEGAAAPAEPPAEPAIAD